MLKNLLMNFN